MPDSRKSDHPGAVQLRDIVRRKYTPLRLRPRFQSFVGYVPAEKQFKMQLVGDKGSGKSTFALELAHEFARFGTVLYVCAEERPDAGTIKIRAKYLGIRSPDIFLLDTAYVADIARELDTGMYRYCFVDSISVIRDGDEATLDMVEEFPGVVFVFVNQVNSEGEARGSKNVGHGCDIVMGFRIDKDGARIAYNFKNRYGSSVEELLVFRPPSSSKRRNKSKDKANWSDMEERRIMRSATRKRRVS